MRPLKIILTTFSIGRAAYELIQEYLEKKQPVEAIFHGVLLYADEGSTTRKIVNSFLKKSCPEIKETDKSRAKRLQKTMTGREILATEKRLKMTASKKHKELMSTLPKLDFRKPVLVINWLSLFQDVNGHSYLNIETETILKIFLEYEFAPYNRHIQPLENMDMMTVYEHIVRLSLMDIETGKNDNYVAISKFVSQWSLQRN